MIRILSDCSAWAPALVPLTVLFLSSCGGGSTATDAAPATASGTLATVSGDPCGIEGSGHQIQSCTPTTGTIPTINSLSPSCAPAGEPAFSLYVNGLNFAASSVVRWNGSDRPTTFDSSSALATQISANDIAAAGTAAVTVFNPAAGGGSLRRISTEAASSPSSRWVNTLALIPGRLVRRSVKRFGPSMSSRITSSAQRSPIRSIAWAVAQASS